MSIFDNSFETFNNDLDQLLCEEITNTIENDKEVSTTINSNAFIKKKRKKRNPEENDTYINDSKKLKYHISNFEQANKCLNNIDVNILTSFSKSIANESSYQNFDENKKNF